MKYYINGFLSPDPTKDFSQFSSGATNFKELLDNVSINNGDYIIVGGPVDDSAEDIAIFHTVHISSYYIGTEFSWSDSNRGVISTNPDSTGITLLGNGSTINNLEFDTDVRNGVCLRINTNSVIVDSCIFGKDTSLNTPDTTTIIDIVDAVNVHIKNSTIYTHITNTLYYCNGIRIDNSRSCVIDNNVIKTVIYDNMSPSTNYKGTGISIVNISNYITIENNIITDRSVSGSFTCVYATKLCDHIITHKNVIGLLGDMSIGIVYDQNLSHGDGMKISNNFIYIMEPDNDSACIVIPYAGTGGTSEYTIINNIIEYNPFTTSAVSNNNDSIAINASIERGIIDYNNIHNFEEQNIFISNGAPNVINEIGPRNIDADSHILLIDGGVYDSGSFTTSYDIDDLKSYYCSIQSEMIGMGYKHHNIGIGIENRDHINQYLNIVDTVTNNLIEIENDDNVYISFINDTLNGTSADYNNFYREGYEVYPSCVYNNQFNLHYDSVDEGYEYPFSIGSDFYRKDIIDIFRNKGELSPFKHIKCPPNRGYGFPEYINYETGLFGYPRVDYINECNPDPCIIQDDFTTDVELIDMIDGYSIIIQDSIHPPCEDDPQGC